MQKDKCPVCRKNCWGKCLQDKDFGLEKCCGCGLVRTITYQRDKIYESREEAEGQFGQDREKHERYAKELLNYLPVNKGSLLDIGAGTGFLVNEANKRGFTAEGIEPAKVFAEVGTKKLGVKLFAASLEKFQTSKKYDVLVLKHVIEHVEDLNFFLQKCRELLKPGGTLLISCPNISSLMFYLFKDRWYGLAPSQHRWQFSPSTLPALLTKTGFRKISTDVINMDYQVPGIKGPIFAGLLAFAKFLGMGDQLVVTARK